MPGVALRRLLAHPVHDTCCGISVKVARIVSAECEKFLALLSACCYFEFGSDVSGLKTIARFSEREYINACFNLCINKSCAPNISICLNRLFLCMCTSPSRGIFTAYCVLERKALPAVTVPRGRQ